MVQTITTTIDWTSIGTFVAASSAVMGCIWQYFGVILKQNDRLTKLETKMELFWDAVGASVSKLIKQPIHFRKDELMDKLMPENLSKLPENSVDELLELKIILKDELITLQELKDPKSLAYALAIAFINQTLYDKGLIKGICK